MTCKRYAPDPNTLEEGKIEIEYVLLKIEENKEEVVGDEEAEEIWSLTQETLVLRKQLKTLDGNLVAIH